MLWILTIIAGDVILSHLEFCFVFRMIRIGHVIRKLFSHESRFNSFSRFDGNSFKVESPSTYSHSQVDALGVYKGAPFVTGSYSPLNKKTEILDYASQQWNVVADYPFTSGAR